MADLTNISSKYDLIEILQKIGNNYFGDELSESRVGMFGFVTESIANMYGSLSFQTNMRAKEFLVSTAMKRSTLQYNAFKLGIDIPDAKPTNSQVYIGIKVDDIYTYGTLVSSDPKVYKLVIEKDSIITIDKYPFKCEFDIELTASYSKETKTYIYTAKYLTEGDTDYTYKLPNGEYYVYPKSNCAEDISDNYISCFRTGSTSKVIVMRVDLKQLEKTTYDYVVTDTDTISLTGIDFAYTNQFSYFNIYYKNSSSNTWTYMKAVPKFDTSSKDENVIYYENLDDDSKIRLDFTGFEPEYNSTIRVEIYTTIGDEVNNLTYTGDGSDIKIQLQSTDNRHTYSGMSIACSPISTNDDGADTLTMDEIRTYLAAQTSLLNAIISERDLSTYLTIVDSYNSYYIAKSRSDIVNMTYSITGLLRDTDDGIIATRSNKIEAPLNNTVKSAGTSVIAGSNYVSPYDIMRSDEFDGINIFASNIKNQIEMRCVDSYTNSTINFKIDHVNIERDIDSENKYVLVVSAMTDGDYSKAIDGDDINVESVQQAIILKGFIYSDPANNVVGAIFDFKFTSYNDGVFTFTSNMKVSPIVVDGKLKLMGDTLYDVLNVNPDGSTLNVDKEYIIDGEKYNTGDDRYIFDPFDFTFGIGCYYLDYNKMLNNDPDNEFLYISDSRMRAHYGYRKAQKTDIDALKVVEDSAASSSIDSTPMMTTASTPLMTAAPMMATASTPTAEESVQEENDESETYVPVVAATFSTAPAPVFTAATNLSVGARVVKVWQDAEHTKSVIYFYYDDIDHSAEGAVTDYSSNSWINDTTVVAAIITSSWGTVKHNFFISFKGMTNLVNVIGMKNMNFVWNYDPNGKIITEYKLVTTADGDLVGKTFTKDTSVYNHYINYSNMFYGCKALKSIDLSYLPSPDAPGHDTNDVMNYSSTENMFYGCENLEHIYTSKTNDWSSWSCLRLYKRDGFADYYDYTDKWKSNNMFYNCVKLPGYNSSMTNGYGCTAYVKNLSYKTSAFGSKKTITTPAYLTYASAATLTPVAVKTSLGTGKYKLTFFYDSENHSEGECYYIKPDDQHPWPIGSNDIELVIFDPSFYSYTELTSLDNWFKGFIALKTVQDVKYLNSQNVKSMKSMFEGCTLLESVEMTGFSTKNVLYMDRLFYGCYNGTGETPTGLKTIDITSFSTYNVTTFTHMFDGCKLLESIQLPSRFITESATDMSYIFNDCIALKSINVAMWYPVNVKNMAYAFNNCAALENIYSGERTGWFSTSCDSENMFAGCTSLPGWVTPATEESVSAIKAKITSYGGYFTLSQNLKMWVHMTKVGTYKFDPDYQGWWTTEADYYNFYPLIKLEFFYDDLSHSGNTFNVGVHRDTDTSSCDIWTQWNGTGDRPWIFSGTKNYEKRDEYGFTYKTSNYCTADLITTVVFDSSFRNARPESVAQMFNNGDYGFGRLSSLNLNYFNTSETKNFTAMFKNSPVPSNVDFNLLDMSGATNTSYMFYNSSGGFTDLRKLDVSNILNMSYMFASCRLSAIDISRWKLRSAALGGVNTNGMFINNSSTRYSNVTYPNRWSLVGALNEGDAAFDTSKNIRIDHAHIGPTVEGNNPYFSISPRERLIVVKKKYNQDYYSLTFYHDTEEHTEDAIEIYNIDDINGNNCPWYKDPDKAYVYKVTFESSFASARVRNLDSWFEGFTNLTEIENINNLNTSEVTTMNYMFKGCSHLASFDLNKLNINSVTSMIQMFNGCTGFTSFTISGMSFTNVVTVDGMFGGCTGLTTVHAAGPNVSNINDMSRMFSGCTSLSTIYGYNRDPWKPSISTGMFDGCTRLPNYGDGSVVDATKACINSGEGTGFFTLTADKEIVAVFQGGAFRFYHDGKDHSKDGGTVYPITEANPCPWAGSQEAEYALYVYFMDSFKTARITSTAHWFECMHRVKAFYNMENLDTSNVTDMQYMFYMVGAYPYAQTRYPSRPYSYIGTVDLSHFNTSKVTNMMAMFEYSTFSSLNFSSFDTSKVTTMMSMFSHCKYLESLDLSTFTANPAKSDYMYMFYNCSALKNVDLSNLVMEHTEDKYTSYRTGTNSATEMFSGCSQLQKIYASGGVKWDPHTARYMFTSCTSLVGGDGTIYNPSYTDDTKAYEGPGGYLTKGANLPLYVKVGSTVTFYNDGVDRSGAGVESYQITPSKPKPWPVDTTVTNIVFDSSFVNSHIYSTASWFEGFTGLLYVSGLQYLPMGAVTDMSKMFADCTSLKSINSDIDWTYDVTCMDVKSVGNMSGVFQNCPAKIIYAASWNTINATDMSNMFYKCENLETCDVSGWTTNKVTTMQNMFSYCKKLQAVDVSEWVTKNILKNSSGMFDHDGELKFIFASNTTPWNPTESNNMFLDCFSLPNYATTSLYIVCTSSATGALEIVEDSATPTETQIRVGDVKPVKPTDGAVVGNYVYKTNANRYEKTSKDTEGALRVIPNNATPTATDILLKNVSPVYPETYSPIPAYFAYEICGLHEYDNKLMVVGDHITPTSGQIRFSDVTPINPPTAVPKCAEYFHTGNGLKVVESNAGAGEINILDVYPYHKISSLVYNDINHEGYGLSDEYEINSLLVVESDAKYGEINISDITSVTPNVTYVPQVGDYVWLAEDGKYRRTVYGLDGALKVVSGIPSEGEININNVTPVYPAKYVPRVGDHVKMRTNSYVTLYNNDYVAYVEQKAYAKCEKDDTGALKVVASGAGTGEINKADVVPVHGSYIPVVGDYVNLCLGDRVKQITPVVDAKKACVSEGCYFTNSALVIEAIKTKIEGTVNDYKFTFYYGSVEHTGLKRYISNEDDPCPWSNDPNKGDVTIVEFDYSFTYARPQMVVQWFNEFTRLKNIYGLNRLNLAKCTSTAMLFRDCEALETLDVSSFNTYNIHYMDYMFAGCKSLKSLDVSNFMGNDIQSTENMFSECEGLELIDLRSFNAPNINNAGWMFNKCKALKKIIVPEKTDWRQLIKADRGIGMFGECPKLQNASGGLTSKEGAFVDKTIAEGGLGKGRFTEGKSKVKYADFSGNTMTFRFGVPDDTPSGTTRFTFDNEKTWPTISYTKCESTDSGALVVVPNNITPNNNQIKISDVDPVYPIGFTPVYAKYEPCSSTASDALKVVYINPGNNEISFNAVYPSEAYSACTQSKTGALKVVASGAGEGEINQADVRPAYPYGFVPEVGTYVALGVFSPVYSSYSKCQASDDGALEVINDLFIDAKNTQIKLKNVRPVYPSEYKPRPTYYTYILCASTAEGAVLVSDSPDKTKGELYPSEVWPRYPFYFPKTGDYVRLVKAYTNCESSEEGALEIVESEAGEGQINLADVTPVYPDTYRPKVGDYVRMNGDHVKLVGEYVHLVPRDYVKLTKSEYLTTTTKVVFDSSFTKVPVLTCEKWFEGFSNLTTIEGLDNLKITDATSTAYMFSGCSSLTSLNLSSLSTSNVETMSCMFNGCTSLNNLNVQFSTASVKYMNSMFLDCSSLQTLDLSTFDTKNILDCAHMFSGCSGLTSLNITNFEFTNINNIWMTNMFNGCSNLESILVKNNSDWRANSHNYNMFKGCSKLPNYQIPSYTKTSKDASNAEVYEIIANTDTLIPYSAYIACGPTDRRALKIVESGGDFNQRTINKSSMSHKYPSSWDPEIGTYTKFVYQGHQIKLQDVTPVTPVKYVPAVNDYVVSYSYLAYQEVTSTTSGALLVVFDNPGEGQIKIDEVTPVYPDTYTPKVGDYVKSLSIIGYGKTVSSTPGSLKVVASGATTGEINIGDITSVYPSSTYTPAIGDCVIHSVEETDSTRAFINSGINTGYFTGNVNLPKAYINGNTMTFFYDTQDHEGTEYLITDADPCPWKDESRVVLKSVETVVFNTSFSSCKVKSTAFWFSEFLNLTTITNIINLQTQSVTDMSYMFANCQSIESLDLRTFDTAEVTTFTNMFLNCYKLSSLSYDVDKFSTKNELNLNSMFRGCHSIPALNVSKFTINLKSEHPEVEEDAIAHMFDDCKNLSVIYGNNEQSWASTSGYEGLDMFAACDMLPSDCTDARAAFVNKAITMNTEESDVPTPPIVMATASPMMAKADPPITGNFTSTTNGRTMKAVYFDFGPTKILYFYYNEKMEADYKDLPGFAGYWEFGPSTRRTWSAFDADTIMFDASFKDARPVNCESWFSKMKKLEHISGWEYFNTSEVNSMHSMFYQCEKLQTPFETKLASLDLSKVEDMSMMFGECTGINSIKFEQPLNTTNLKNAANMFEGCTGFGLTDARVDLSGINTTSLETVAGMFSGSNLSHFISFKDSENLWVTSAMFEGCENLVIADFSELTSTKKFGIMQKMFKGCKKLETFIINPDIFMVTNNCQYMDSMFEDCEKLQGVNLSKWNTAGCYHFENMFKNCKFNLTAIDVSSFTINASANLDGMFNGCAELVTITSANTTSWGDSTRGSDMFTGCVKLVGGNGCIYDSTKVTAEQAIIPTLEGAIGYFTGTTVKTPKVLIEKKNNIYEMTFFYDTDPRLGEKVFAVQDIEEDPLWITDDPDELYKQVRYVHFNTSFKDYPVTKMYHWFKGFTSLYSVDFGNGNINLSGVTTMNGLFAECGTLEIINGAFPAATSEVEDMTQMFYGCSKLDEIDVRKFSIDGLTKADQMFYGCSGIKHFIADKDTDWRNKGISGSDMFTGCTGITEPTTYISSSTGISMAYTGGYFYNTSEATEKAVVDGSTMTFCYDNDPHTGKVTYGITKAGLPQWNDKDMTGIKTVEFDSTFINYKPSTCYKWFDQFRGLETISGLQYLDTSEVNDMSYMFSNCSSIKSISLRTDNNSFNTKNVTNMKHMFVGCSELKSIDFGNAFNTTKVTTMSTMFAGCAKLQTATPTDPLTDFSINGFVTSTELVYVDSMFRGCSGLKKIAFNSNFKTTNVKTMTTMFSGCTSLKSITGTNNFDTTNVETFTSMFGAVNSAEITLAGCTALEEVYIRNFVTTKATSMVNMFKGCSSLKTLDVTSFSINTSAYLDGMFSGCSSLTNIYSRNTTKWNPASSISMFEGCTGGLPHWNETQVRDATYSFVDNGNYGFFSVQMEMTVGITEVRNNFIGDPNTIQVNDYVIKLICTDMESIPGTTNSYPVYCGLIEYESGKDNHDYTLCDVYSNLKDKFNLYEDMTSIIRLDKEVASDNSNSSVMYLTHVPCITSSDVEKYNDRIREIMFNAKTYLTNIKERLLNNFETDFRFYNTSGSSDYFKLTYSDDSQSISLSELSIELDLTVVLNENYATLDSDVTESIKVAIKKSIESGFINNSNNKLYISSALHDVAKQFENYIRTIEFNSVNKQDSRYRVIKYVEPDGSDTYIPEFISVPVDKINLSMEN